MPIDICEHHLSVRKTARYLTVQNGDGGDLRWVWIACHGFGQLAPRFAQQLMALAQPRVLLVIPEALNRFYVNDKGGVHGPDAPVGATWMTREERLLEIEDYVAYLDSLHDEIFASVERARVRLGALGFSQGVATVARWAARRTRPVDDVVLWASSLPPELEPAPDLFGTARVTCVFGTRDQFASAAAIAREQERLTRSGLAARWLSFEGGHRLDDDTLRGLVE